MTHTHEWLFDIYEKNEKTVRRFVCRHDFCDEVLEGPEVLKRLNATDRLSAEDAETASYTFKDTTSDEHRIQLALRCYAAAREGKE